MFERLRTQLDERGIPAEAVVRPGSSVQALDGALRLEPVASGGFELQTVDYGTGYPLGVADDEESATELLLQYVDRPVPTPTTLPPAELDALVTAQSPGFADLVDRTQEGSLLIEAPPGLVLDRLGVLDGVHLFPYGTSFEARSLVPLPMQPTVGRFAFRVTQPLRVRVQVAAPWFGFTGGGLRCTLAQDLVGIRDLVIDGRLERIEPNA